MPVGQNPITGGNRFSNSLNDTGTIEALLEGATVPINAKTPAQFGIAGVFTDPAVQAAVRMLSQTKGVDLSSSPSIVARSGERAKVSLVREFIYPTEFDPPEIPQEAAGGGAGGASFPVTPTTPTTFETKETGMVF